jgi:hypothetical protein
VTLRRHRSFRRARLQLQTNDKPPSSQITIYHISHTTYHRVINNMAGQGMVDPAIFEDLQARVDEDTAVRDVRAPFELRTTSH